MRTLGERIRSFLLLMLVTPFCFADVADYMAANDVEQVQKWLDVHKEYRLATLNDCECDDNILPLRQGDGKVWKAQPKYQPYYAIGDFDNDGMRDFAVVVRRIMEDEKPLVLVFLKGKIKHSTKPIVYSIHEKSVSGIGLFLSRSKPRKLLVGAFASEGEEIPLSKGKR